jgi:hypothetical protein
VKGPPVAALICLHNPVVVCATWLDETGYFTTKQLRRVVGCGCLAVGLADLTVAFPGIIEDAGLAALEPGHTVKHLSQQLRK